VALIAVEIITGRTVGCIFANSIIANIFIAHSVNVVITAVDVRSTTLLSRISGGI
jgi:hypothetical protein